jgi:hypothetical protein
MYVSIPDRVLSFLLFVGDFGQLPPVKEFQSLIGFWVVFAKRKLL